jgi:hypothetical protein
LFPCCLETQKTKGLRSKIWNVSSTQAIYILNKSKIFSLLLFIELIFVTSTQYILYKENWSVINEGNDSKYC